MLLFLVVTSELAPEAPEVFFATAQGANVQMGTDGRKFASLMSRNIFSGGYEIESGKPAIS